jgi:uncharacterized protein involved in response to NO
MGLAALVALWGAGRLAVLFSAVFAGNVVFHFEDHVRGAGQFGARLGVGAAISLISLIGGRVVPSFTRNWLARENPGRVPQPFGHFDRGVLATSAVAVALWVLAPQWPPTGAVLLFAAVIQTIRLARWAGDRTLRDRLVLILHIGSGFVPLGFLIVGGAILFPGAVPSSGGVHAWTVGAIGTLTLAMMTRASLGHTGQPLSGGRLTQAIYALVILAAAFRIAAAFAPGSAFFCCTQPPDSGLPAFGALHRIRAATVAIEVAFARIAAPHAGGLRNDDQNPGAAAAALRGPLTPKSAKSAPITPKAAHACRQAVHTTREG